MAALCHAYWVGRTARLFAALRPVFSGNAERRLHGERVIVSVRRPEARAVSVSTGKSELCRFDTGQEGSLFADRPGAAAAKQQQRNLAGVFLDFCKSPQSNAWLSNVGTTGLIAELVGFKGERHTLVSIP
jgi:hypothetical protein